MILLRRSVLSLLLIIYYYLSMHIVLANQLCYQTQLSTEDLPSTDIISTLYPTVFAIQAQYADQLLKLNQQAPAATCQHDNQLVIHINNIPSLSHYISIQYVATFYFYHNAHPMTYYQTVNYVITQNEHSTQFEPVAFASIFTDQQQALGVLSSYSRQRLIHRLITTVDALSAEQQGTLQQMIEAGTVPVLANFQHWNLTTTGLLITFDPTQVAPYYYGKQQVLVPYDQLQAVLIAKFMPK